MDLAGSSTSTSTSLDMHVASFRVLVHVLVSRARARARSRWPAQLPDRIGRWPPPCSTSTSVSLDIAEAAGETPTERTHFHRSARGSATECGAIVEVLGEPAGARPWLEAEAEVDASRSEHVHAHGSRARGRAGETRPRRGGTRRRDRPGHLAVRAHEKLDES